MEECKTKNKWVVVQMVLCLLNISEDVLDICICCFSNNFLLFVFWQVFLKNTVK